MIEWKAFLFIVITGGVLGCTVGMVAREAGMSFPWMLIPVILVGWFYGYVLGRNGVRWWVDKP